jgi:hypothetical protein
MPHQQCLVCASPLRAEIDKALQDGQPSLRELSRQVGISYQAIWRHSQHGVPGKPKTVSNIKTEISKLRCAQTAAKRRRDSKAVVALSKEIRAWTQLEAKTRNVVPVEPEKAKEPTRSEALTMAKAIIEMELQSQEIAVWIQDLAERLKETGTTIAPDADEH